MYAPSEEPLQILQAFCKGNLNLLAAENGALLKMIQHDMPPFWNLLAQILKLENTSVLSRVRKILNFGEPVLFFPIQCKFLEYARIGTGNISSELSGLHFRFGNCGDFRGASFSTELILEC